MGVLAVYDTVGIQNYIFASNKLAENVGGSKLVADVFARTLPCVIKKTEPNLPKWRDCVDKPLDPTLKAEIIYEGGGNAYVAYRDGETFQKVTKEFLTRVAQTAPGIGIAVAAIETNLENNYTDDFKTLNKRLTLVKGGFNMPTFAGNQPITKQSGRTGLPTTERDNKDNEYLSESQSMKRKKYRLFKEENKDSKAKTEDAKPCCRESEAEIATAAANDETAGESAESITKERGGTIENFDDLAFEKGKDSLIAIIHADGNNMGSRIKKKMESLESYTNAVPAIRGLSKAINDCYKNAADITINAFNEAYAAYISSLREKDKDKYSNEKYDTPPLLELINDGDDITLVICGRFAIDFAARLLREIGKQDDPFENGTSPTACAGVVLFNSHYPFSEAYKLAEELCASAKKRAREHEPSSFMDIHLHQSGNVAGLEHLRKRQYTIDGKTILRRPWSVTSADGADPDFKWFEENVIHFVPKEIEFKPKTKPAKYPRNKMKALRDAIGAGDRAAELVEHQLRGIKLPTLDMPKNENDKTEPSKYAAIYDILELSDVYVNLLNREGGKDDGDQ